MLVRGTLGRWAAAPTAARDLPQLARFLHQTLAARNASTLPAARAITRAYRAVLGARRSYATTTAATKPTATVKKAVKARVAAKPAARKTAATKATKTAKKPAKKPAKKATAAKAKPKAKKKAAPKKPAPKKPVKKVVSPEQKEKAKIRELRQLALKEPTSRGVVSAINAYVTSIAKGQSGQLGAAAKGFKDLTPAEREVSRHAHAPDLCLLTGVKHYNHLANQATAAKQAEYDAWIQSHTPEQIHTANLARAQLRKKLVATKTGSTRRHTAKLIDARRGKRPTGPYLAFLKERYATGDMKGISVIEATRIIAAEWKALGASEKKVCALSVVLRSNTYTCTEI
jgi:outer membrane biosynthesis protein TonB